MSLFADLPPPTAHLRPKPQTQEDQQPMPQQQEVEEPDEQDTSSEEPDYDEREQQERSSAEPESEGAEDPPTKRVKFASDAADHDGPSTSGQALPEGQVLMALKKIRSHIGNASKFSKASQLLRQLFDTKAITRACRDEAFLAVRAAFPTFTAPFQLDVQRDYMRLCHCIDKHQGALSKPQRAHFAIYYIVGMIGNQLNTDDSFQFNKVLTKLKEMVNELPPCKDVDDIMLSQLMDASSGCISMECSTVQLPHAESASAAASGQPGSRREEADVEFDPFGLDSLLDAPAPKPAVVSKPSSAWGAAETLTMRRQALIEVLHQAKTYHKLPWARTSVEVLIEHFIKHRDSFTRRQGAELDELSRFVRQARHVRAQGPSQKEINRDTTTFERARAEWSKVEISNRSKVGAQGDNKSQNWLG